VAQQLPRRKYSMKNIYFYGLTVLYLSCFLWCTGCDVVYRLLDKEGAQEKELVGEIVPYQKNYTIEEAQKLLDLYGYSPGRIDGILGLKTRNAIERFQRANGIKESRFIDQATWEKLSIFKENGFIVNEKLNVALVQKALKKADFDPGKIDGKFGPRTLRAVKEFQEARGLKVDGKVGYKTLMALAEYMD